MKKDRFMQQLNHSFREGGLICSFNDFQLAEFIQQKLRSEGKLRTKKAVGAVGEQDDGTWVFGPDVYFSSKGELVDPEHTQYMWIGHLYEGPGIVPFSTSCHIHLPLTTDCLQEVICHFQSLSQHNFIQTLLVLGACAMAMHYHTILQKFMFCPVPIAFGHSCTGKTTALRCGLFMCGVYPTRFFSKASLEKYMFMS